MSFELKWMLSQVVLVLVKVLKINFEKNYIGVEINLKEENIFV